MKTKHSYSFAHSLVAKKLGKPKRCEHCGTQDKSANFEWASVSKDYENTEDYIRLCRPCHCKFDKLVDNFKSSRKISEQRKEYLRKWRLGKLEERRKREREKARLWRKNNPEKAKIQDRIKRERYKEKRKEYQRKYYLTTLQAELEIIKKEQ